MTTKKKKPKRCRHKRVKRDRVEARWGSWARDTCLDCKRQRIYAHAWTRWHKPVFDAHAEWFE